MRCSQPMGLPQEAISFLKENAKSENKCFSCGRSDGFIKKEIGYTGMFNEIPLYEYQLIDGGVAKEFVQYDYWSSGPVEFFGLEVFNGGTSIKKFLWSEDAIRAYEED